ncbi:hypothetical protein CMI37_30680 [Candidatus Pacearchaeota archaeon]|nr:hypothetical protein [Candidatus Pacearchaeota archaeon]|tara:strand:- start:708 stop:1280 length:573 start_codon:yes stop_codon:yes gene_type:complete
MKLDIEKNFDFNKIQINKLTSEWLNQVANRINKSIQDGLKTGIDINEKTFTAASDFTRNSIQDGASHKRPLVRSGRMGETRILRPTPAKLKFQVTSGIRKSKKRWNVNYKGTKSSGTRAKSKINYGKLQNEGFFTSKKSLIKKNVYVKAREWFGIPKNMLPMGDEWLKFAVQYNFTFQKFLTTAMKKFRK